MSNNEIINNTIIKDYNKKGIVYILKNNNSNVYKIGKTNEVESKRINHLNKHLDLDLFNSYFIFTDDSLGLERFLHETFKDKNIKDIYNKLNIDKHIKYIGKTEYFTIDNIDEVFEAANNSNYLSKHRKLTNEDIDNIINTNKCQWFDKSKLGVWFDRPLLKNEYQFFLNIINRIKKELKTNNIELVDVKWKPEDNHIFSKQNVIDYNNMYWIPFDFTIEELFHNINIPVKNKKLVDIFILNSMKIFKITQTKEFYSSTIIIHSITKNDNRPNNLMIEICQHFIKSVINNDEYLYKYTLSEWEGIK